MANRTAFEILYKEYYVRVYGLCRRLLGSSETAEDAAQEAFMRAFRSFHRFDSEQPFWQWIATIANRCCIDALRRQDKREDLFGDEADELAQLAGAEAPVLSEVIAAEDKALLSGAIAQLPARYRVPLVLAYFNGSSYDDIAGALGVTRNHVGVLLLRARQQLKADLAAERGAVS